MVNYEFGSYPIVVTRKIRIFKYWLKVMNSGNCILQGCYNYLNHMCTKNSNDVNNWVCNIRTELFRLGLKDLWYLQSSPHTEHVLFIKQRLYDICKQEFDAVLRASPKCNLYQYLVSYVD